MRKLLTALLLVSVFLVSAVMIQAAGPYDNYLNAAEVEKISGIKGVKIVPKDPAKGAGGDLNFATGEGTMVIMVQVLDPSYYARFKQSYFKAAVSGIGEEAFQGASVPNNPSNILIFKNKNKCLVLTTFMNFSNFGKNMLTMDQLIAIGKLIAPRM